METWIVYALLDKTGKPIYVGVSRNFPRRLREHKKLFGYKPKYEILEKGDGDRIEAEHRWIEEYRKRGYKLQNKTIGGNGCQTASLKTRKKISDFWKGRKKPEGFGKKMSELLKGQSRNWTPEGEKNVRKTQFKPGTNLWASLNGKQRKQILKKKMETRASHPEIIAEQKRKCSQWSKNRWMSLTQKQKSEHGKKIAKSRRQNHTPEELSRIASKNAKAALKKPNARKRLSNQIKRWWANLTPKAKAEYVAKRAERIKESRARKNAAREGGKDREILA